MKKLCIVALLVPLAALAEDKKKRDFTKLAVVEGTIVCIGCELEKDGADPQCTLHSKHAQGLLDKDGNLWTFVDNKRGHALATNEKLRGREVKVKGWKFEKARYVEAWMYDSKDKDKDTWTTMSHCDNCGWEKGDHGEEDLCEDCKE